MCIPVAQKFNQAEHDEAIQLEKCGEQAQQAVLAQGRREDRGDGKAIDEDLNKQHYPPESTLLCQCGIAEQGHEHHQRHEQAH